MTDGAPNQEQALRLLRMTIRTFRKRRRLTQRVLAARVGLTRTYVSAIEHGQRNVTMGTLLLIAAALQVPLSTLLQPLEDHPELYTLSREEQQEVSYRRLLDPGHVSSWLRIVLLTFFTETYPLEC